MSKDIKFQKIKCPKCGKKVDIGNMTAHMNGKNCKKKSK